MKTVLPLILGLFPSLAGAQAPVNDDDGSVACKEKSDDDVCEKRVQVHVSDLVFGLRDDLPEAVYTSFAKASSQCLHCVDNNEVTALDGVDVVLTYEQCSHILLGCFCCTHKYCIHRDLCPSQCGTYYPECFDRRLSGNDDADGDDKDKDDEQEELPAFFNFEVNVCMDDVTPVDGSDSYIDYNTMLADFEKDLGDCYADRETFVDTWSALCAESGVDLSLMVRSDKYGDTSKILFGVPGIDMDSVKVTTYGSSDSHRSSSNTIFYGALGFIAVSMFAVVGTAVVVKALKNRREESDEQAAKWIAEMNSGGTVNPMGEGGASGSH